MYNFLVPRTKVRCTYLLLLEEKFPRADWNNIQGIYCDFAASSPIAASYDRRIPFSMRGNTTALIVNLFNIHSIKNEPRINYLKSPLKEIVEILFVTKLAQLSAICLLVCLQCVSSSQVFFANVTIDKNIEQRIYLKFCIANGNSCAEPLKMLQKAYIESTLSRARAYEWYSAFKSGRNVVEDLPR